MKIRNFSSSVDKYFKCEYRERVKYFSILDGMYNLLFKHQQNTKPFRLLFGVEDREHVTKERFPTNLLSSLFPGLFVLGCFPSALSSTPSKSHHFTFAAKGAIYYVIIAKVIFSTVKTTC